MKCRRRFAHPPTRASSFNTHVSLVTLLNTHCIRNAESLICTYQPASGTALARLAVCHQTRRFLADGLANLLHKYSRIYHLLFEQDNTNTIIIIPVHLFMYMAVFLIVTRYLLKRCGAKIFFDSRHSLCGYY